MTYAFNFRSAFCLVLLFFCGSMSFAQAAATDEADAQETLTEYDFHVTSAYKDKTHPYYGKGDSMGFVINGVPGMNLELVRGKAYTFRIDTGVMHDFYIATKAIGWGKAALTKDVKGNFTYKGVVTFTPSANTPDTVYYVCRNHKYMGGEIHVVNANKAAK